MYVRKRIGRRRSLLRKHRLLIFLLACAGIFVFAFALRQAARVPVITPGHMPPKATSVPDLRPQLQPAEHERAIYPYSVIPGGIRSRAELVTHMAHDPVVLSHYANFDISQAKFIRSKENVFVYIAYRLGNNVFWTARTVKIPEGEPLISDGNSVARARCGNKISVLPQEPVSEEEPPIETFEIPTFEPVMIASLEPPQLDLPIQPELLLEPRPIEPVIPYVPIQTPLLANLRSGSVRPLALYPRIYEIPEPGTISLMIIGMAVFAIVRLTCKK